MTEQKKNAEINGLTEPIRKLAFDGQMIHLGQRKKAKASNEIRWSASGWLNRKLAKVVVCLIVSCPIWSLGKAGGCPLLNYLVGQPKNS